MATENAEAVYLIAARTNAGEDRPVCTAFALAPTYLGTNAHCVEAMQAASDRGETVVAVRNGASGSPLFDRRGEVIAIDVGHRETTGVSVSIRIDGLLPLLEERR